MAHYIYQSDINKIDKECYSAIDNLVLKNNDVIPKIIMSETVVFTDINELDGRNMLLNISSGRFVNCDLASGAIILNNRIEDIRVIDSTIYKFKLNSCRGYMITITDSFIDELDVTQSILNRIYINNSIVNKIKIYDTVIKGGLHISLDSNVKSITIIQSLIDNTQVVIDNSLMNNKDYEFNPEKLYEEDIEDAVDKFVLLNACIIGNNSSDEIYNYRWSSSIIKKDLCATTDNNNIIAGVHKKGDITDEEVKH